MVRDDEICQVSGISKESCTCEKCEPIVIDVCTPLLEVRNVVELSEKISAFSKLMDYLRNGFFQIIMSADADYIQIHSPHVEGAYWAQCKGCGYPYLVDYGEDAGLFCKSCSRNTQAEKEGHPRYYDDLFNYIDLNLRNMRIPTGYDSELPLTQEFCEAYSFDFKVIKARLNATGGYDPGEVLMNSMWSIPWFDKLPLKIEEEDG